MDKLLFQLYGHSAGVREEEPLNLQEVSLVADRPTIEALARFLLHSLEDDSAMSEHLHLRDCWPSWKEGMPDVIVFIK